MNSNDTSAPAKLQSVQALRGIAAFLVLLFHVNALQLADGEARSRAFGAFWEQGYAGVDLFFVISGFIMVYVTRELAPSIGSAGRFLYARITRIYPLWWVFAACMAGYFFVAYGQPAPPDRVESGGVLAYLLKSFFLLPQANTPVLGVGWTLIHEMLFYVIFAAGLLFSGRYLLAWLGVWGGLIIAASVIQLPPNHAGDFWQLLTSPLNIEFILGAAIGWIFFYRKLTPGLGGKWLLIFGGLYFALNLLRDIGGGDFFLWKRVLAYGLPCAVLLLGAVMMEREGKISVPAWLSKIGDWSYSLYLVHMLVLLAIRRVWKGADGALPESMQFGAEGMLDNILFAVLGITLSLLASAISYKLIEKPALKLLRGQNG